MARNTARSRNPTHNASEPPSEAESHVPVQRANGAASKGTENPQSSSASLLKRKRKDVDGGTDAGESAAAGAGTGSAAVDAKQAGASSAPASKRARHDAPAQASAGTEGAADDAKAEIGEAEMDPESVPSLQDTDLWKPSKLLVYPAGSAQVEGQKDSSSSSVFTIKSRPKSGKVDDILIEEQDKWKLKVVLQKWVPRPFV